jgi:ABC-type Na+ efflux pump permease subunit
MESILIRKELLMKKKYCFVIICLFLLLALSGCTGTPSTQGSSAEENIVKGIVYNFYSALSDSNWSKAQNYCVYGSDAYYVVSQFKNLSDTAHAICASVIIDFYVFVTDVSVMGTYAEADCQVNIFITGCGSSDTQNQSGTMTLQKIGNSWKLY